MDKYNALKLILATSLKNRLRVKQNNTLDGFQLN